MRACSQQHDTCEGQMDYRRIDEANRNNRRSVADALAVLSTIVQLDSKFHAVVCISLMKLPSGEICGLVNIHCEVPGSDITYVASLPTSARFHGRRAASQSEFFEIDRLHGGMIDSAGVVTLTDGQQIRSVEVEPAGLQHRPSELDWRIVHLTLSMIKGAERCYRSLGETLPEPHATQLSNFLFLDCSKLSGLDVPPLKVIAAHIRTQDKTLKNLSLQKIADALSKFGIRIVRPRPRTR